MSISEETMQAILNGQTIITTAKMGGYPLIQLEKQSTYSYIAYEYDVPFCAITATAAGTGNKKRNPSWDLDLVRDAQKALANLTPEELKPRSLIQRNGNGVFEVIEILPLFDPKETVWVEVSRLMFLQHIQAKKGIGLDIVENTKPAYIEYDEETGEHLYEDKDVRGVCYFNSGLEVESNDYESNMRTNHCYLIPKNSIDK